MITLAEETTTLAEGATVSIIRGHNPKVENVSTYLVASRDRETLRMRVDDVAPGSLRTYLELVVREIQRERSKITKKPDIQLRSPDTIHEFVHNMAAMGMFIFTALDNADLTGNSRLQMPSGKAPRKRKRKDHHKDT